MAETEAIVAGPEAGDWTAWEGPSYGHQRDPPFSRGQALWILRTGAPWRDLPERFGPWATVASRFYRWRKQGLWERLLAEVQREADAIGQVEREVHYVDGTNVRAHQHAAGAKKGRAIRRWAVPGEGSGPKSI